MAPAKKNSPGLGIEYEVHIPAYFALFLNVNPNVENFTLQCNVENFGKFDDLLVDITTKSGEKLHFAFQLKHKENVDVMINPISFYTSRPRADNCFFLKKYCESFKKLGEENRKKYHFILYTNKNFDSSSTNKVEKFDMKQDECCLGRNFFDTSGSGKHLYKFEINKETEEGKDVSKEDYREFFKQFRLYTGQAKIRDLEESISDNLKCKEGYPAYIDFFRRWHRGDFMDKILDKKTLNIHLVDIFLSSVVINNYQLSDGQDENLNFFEKLVQQFDITIINASKQNFVQQLEKTCCEEFFKNSEEKIILLGKENKFIDKSTNELKEEMKIKLWHYFFKKLLILDVNENSENLIYEASKFIKENEIKLVIVGRGIVESKFSLLKIFRNLTEVDNNLLEETKKKCKLFLQGRNNISFEEIFEDEIREFVTPREIFQMLKGNFSIGEAKETLPECYIPRKVSTTVFDIESIIKHSSGSDVIVFYCESNLEGLDDILNKNLMRSGDYWRNYSGDAVIFRPTEFSKQLNEDIPTIILRKEYSREQLNDIHKNHKEADNISLFKVIDKNRSLLISTKSISIENCKPTKLSVGEDDIHIFFDNSVNILCAKPGMGKSALMRRLKNKCYSSFLKIGVDLKAHNQFLMKNQKIEDVLNYFLQLENCQDSFLSSIKKMFRKKQKILFFLDGLDEVENECVDYVLNITKQLSEMGFRIWLSSRKNLQQKLENYFNIFAIDIDELDINEQKIYIEERLTRGLTSHYNEKEIRKIVNKIFNNTDLVHNSQILKIPLQLQIIAQIFIDNYSSLSENDLLLTKMLEIFEGKYKHFVTKFESRNPHLFKRLEEQLEKIYEIVALHSVLNDEHFRMLQIEKTKLTEIKNSDFLGIITEVNRENKAVFENLAFAEYFASKFLVKNVKKVLILNEEIFIEKYRNFRIFFNILQAENSSTHYF